jgi:hypothetical protein
MIERRFVRPEDLAELVGAVYGSARRVAALERLAGGSKKGVYRLALDDGATAVLYVWSDAENYWPAGAPVAGPFAEASGFDLFEAATSTLDSIGVRTPEVVFADNTGRYLPADLALVEDLRGGTLEQLIARSPGDAAGALDELGHALAAMSRHTGPRIGKVAHAGRDGDDRAAVRVVLERALDHLSASAARVPEIAVARGRISDHLMTLAAAVSPRREYAVIHGELGPDHVLIDGDGRPVLIDIEGLMYFDVEWEHAFARMRFRSDYGPLRVPGLDEDRLRLYDLAQSLSLVEGPLRIADGDFPDRRFMLDLAAYHTTEVLRMSSSACF